MATLVAALSAAGKAQSVIGEMFASDASVHGSVLFASGGMQIQSGSSVGAGEAPAVLKLRRGGEVRVCPKTTVSVSSSASGRDLLWGMSTGTIEAHFALSSSADTVMTPDFRIMLAGPGIFHFAISADAQGDVCVRALPMNTASLIVTELNGDGTYQVKPTVQVLFKKGSVADPSPMVPPDCGCPPPPPLVEEAMKAPESVPAPSHPISEHEFYPPPPLPKAPTILSWSTPLPPQEGEHLMVDQPFVYQAGEREQDLANEAARLRLISGTTFAAATVAPPPSQPNPQSKPEANKSAAVNPPKRQEKKGFFGRIGSFFSSVFK
jgi:hypothetical protein